MVVGIKPAEIMEWLLEHWCMEGCRAAEMMLALICKYLARIVAGVMLYIRTVFLYTLIANA